MTNSLGGVYDFAGGGSTISLVGVCGIYAT